MKLAVRDAILTALSYADIFDYPLTEEEVRVWTPFIKRPRLAMQGEALRKFVYRLATEGDTYYSLRPTKRLIATRNKRSAWSMDKWIRARRVASILKYIPTIKLVGVTGGLTRSNARAQDDIDFLIITSPKTLWVTRALSTILLDIFRLRRRPTDLNVRNLVCLNMFMSEDGLTLSRKERDLFTAHEVLLMTPLWEKGGIYAKFLRANTWVKKFLPNAWELKNVNGKRKKDGRKNEQALLRLPFTVYLLPLLEVFVKTIQLWYMRKRRSTEIITNNVIRFHPRDARVWIKRKLRERLARFNIPLDKIFYGR